MTPIYDNYTKYGSNINCFPSQPPLGLERGPDTASLENRINPYIRGILGPPNGPVDNVRKTLLQQINGFGFRPSHLYGQDQAIEGSYKTAAGLPSYPKIPLDMSGPIIKPKLIGGVVQNMNFNEFGKKKNKHFKFGKMNPLYYSKNNVGHEAPLGPMYHAGGTTINYADGNLYAPIGLVAGPTNSTGHYASLGTFENPIMSVQNDGMTKNSYLSFGGDYMSFNPLSDTTGIYSLYQPFPNYLNNNKNVSGAYVSYGKKNRSVVKKKEHKKEPQKNTLIRSKPKLTRKSSSELKFVKTKYNGVSIKYFRNGKIKIEK